MAELPERDPIDDGFGGAVARRLEQLGLLPSLLIAASSGFVIALGAPPDGLRFANWVGFVPLILMATRDAVSTKEAAAMGLAGGLGIGLGGFPWIGEMLVKFAGVPVVVGCLGVLLFSAWMAIPYGIWAAGLRLGPRRGLPGWLWPAALFAAVQYSWPVLFPYSPILGFAETPPMMQLAEVLGVHGIEAVVVAASVFLARGIVARGWRSRIGNLVLWSIAPLLLYVGGDLRMQAIDREAENAPKLRVGIIQPNLGIHSVSRGQKMQRLTETSLRAEEQGAELIVWPEAGTYPYLISRPFTGDSNQARSRVLARHKTPTVFGARSRDPGARFNYNSAYFIDGAGRALGAYDKVNLVPLGESIPIIDPAWVTERIPEIGHRLAGDTPARFVLPRRARGPAGLANVDPKEISFAPLICYEDIIPGYVRLAAAQTGGVDLFVNLTIDSWYGDTAEPWEHLALAQFRAVEHRVPIVRSVSTGVSAVIDANGRVVSFVPLRPVTPENLEEFPPELLVETLSLARNTARNPTVYARFGWMFPHLCQLVAILGFVNWLWRSRLET
ncbi:MAG: apolipoprotein N-acyltransferase [Myxococcales bacterium]|nr:apolipoprotein N-acyltransferase [Myxococcales bacterium]